MWGKDIGRYIILAVTMLIVWFSLIGFIYLKADEITRDPCGICAEQHGSEVICTTGTSYIPVTKIYYPNGTEYIDRPEIKYNVPKINITILKPDESPGFQVGGIDGPAPESNEEYRESLERAKVLQNVTETK